MNKIEFFYNTVIINANTLEKKIRTMKLFNFKRFLREIKRGHILIFFFRLFFGVRSFILFELKTKLICKKECS
jgi:hypothetical protein